MEELFESEVMWDEYLKKSAGSSTRRNVNAASNSTTTTTTAPMKIPAPAARRYSRANEYCREGGDEPDLVPPHVLVSRTGSAPGKMAFSVCSGQGRTLKGRDLTHVRDSVMRMTGYLES